MTFTMANFTQKPRLLSVSTSLGEDSFLLRSFKGCEGISSPFLFVLDAVVNAQVSVDDGLIGQTVDWSLADENQHRSFNGVIHQCEVIHTDEGNPASLRMTVVPWFYLLRYNSDCQVFQQQTVIEIITALFKSLGFSDYVFKVNKSLGPREYCVQYNETTFDFISRLLAEEGLFYFFDHQKSKHTMVIADSKVAYVKKSEQSLKINQSGSVSRCIDRWECKYSFNSGAVTTTDYDYVSPSLDLTTETKTILHQKHNSQLSHFFFPGNYDDKSEGVAGTKLLMQSEEVNSQIYDAASNYRSLTAGGLVTVQGKEYVITQIEHESVDESHFSGAQANQHYANTFRCILSKVPFRPQIEGQMKPKISSVQTAKVVGPSAEEIYTDKYGRVKVQFFWDRYGKNDEKSSCWVRVAQISAGKQWGALCLPRVGDEVVVNFLDGDPDKPLVTGSVYNGDQLPQYDLPANKTISGFKTHSTKEGQAADCNEVYFDDKKDNELFYVHAQKDRKVIVENDDSLSVKNDQHIEITKNVAHTVVEGDVTFKVQKGKRDTEIEQDDCLKIAKGSHNIEISQGNHELKITQGNRAVKVSMGNDELTISKGNHSTKVSLGKSTTSAMQGIELVVGQNSIKIDQSGITLDGMMVKINGKVMTQVNSSAMLQLKGSITMIN